MATKGNALIDAATDKVLEAQVPYLDSQVQILGSASVDMLSVATTLLYTVPAGKKLVATLVYVECTVSDSPGFGSAGSVGANNPSYNDILFNFFSIPTTVGAVNNQGGALGSGGQWVTLAAGSQVYVNITTGDGGTDLDCTFYLEGFLV